MRGIILSSLLVLSFVMIASALLPDQVSQPMASSGRGSNPNDSATRVVHALWELFGHYAEFDIDVQLALWQMTPRELHPLLGLAKIILLFITFWGLAAIGMADTLMRRLFRG